MKRILLSVAILAVAASCSKNEVVDIPQTNEITFSTLNDRVVSKAANDGGQDYAVLAYLDGTTTAWYIDDYTSTIGAGGANDVLNGLYYYPTGDFKLTFYAYAPYDFSDSKSDDGVTTSSPGTATIDYTVPDDADEDFTIATKVEKTEASENTTVAFTFSHMLSKVTVTVEVDESIASAYLVTDSDDETYDSTSDPELPITGENSLGSITAALTVLFDTQTANVITGEWVNNQTTENANVTVNSGGSDNAVTYSGESTYMVLPQTLSKGCTLALENVKIFNRNTGAKVHVGALANIPLETIEDVISSFESFDPGYHYQFTITITNLAKDDGDEPIFGSLITFTSTTADWTDYYSSIVDSAAEATITNALMNALSAADSSTTAYAVDATDIEIAEGTKLAITLDGSEYSFASGDTIVFTFNSSYNEYLSASTLSITDSTQEAVTIADNGSSYYTFDCTGAVDATGGKITFTVGITTVGEAS